MKYRIDWHLDPRGYVEVDGEPVAFPGFGRWRFFVAEDPAGSWTVTEESTGCYVCSEPRETREEAMRAASENLKKCTAQRFARMLASMLREHGPIAKRGAPRRREGD